MRRTSVSAWTEPSRSILEQHATALPLRQVGDGHARQIPQGGRARHPSAPRDGAGCGGQPIDGACHAFLGGPQILDRLSAQRRLVDAAEQAEHITQVAAQTRNDLIETDRRQRFDATEEIDERGAYLVQPLTLRLRFGEIGRTPLST